MVASPLAKSILIANRKSTRYSAAVESVGKLMVGAGLALTALGLLLWLGFGRERGGLLPGDISVEQGGFKFYFPIVTCVVVSVVLSLMLRLFRK